MSRAGSIEEALRLARGERFDLYVLDKLFPEGDGTDLCRELRGRNPQALVVIYSGAAYDEDRRAGFGVGAEAYVTKPNVEGLVAVVNDLLKGKALPHDRFSPRGEGTRLTIHPRNLPPGKAEDLGFQTQEDGVIAASR